MQGDTERKSTQLIEDPAGETMKVSFTGATPRDADTIFRMARRLIEEYETDLSLDFEKVFDFDWVTKKIERNIETYHTIHVNGVKVGYFCVLDGGEGLELDTHMSLMTVRDEATVHEYWNTWFLWRDMDKAVFLHVFKENYRAINLYKRNGFEIVASVGDSRYIMKKSSRSACEPYGSD